VTLRAIPNISEGRDAAKIAYIAGDSNQLLDIHSDPDHNRSVLTYDGIDALSGMIERAVATLDIRTHERVHPRFGVVDVLPFVGNEAQTAADDTTWAIAQTVGVPVYRYGKERTLPELRRWLRTSTYDQHPTAGVICVGVRDPLVAFNVNLDATLDEAKRIAKQIRDGDIRALAFELPSRGLTQVSMNLVNPNVVGADEALARIAALTEKIVGSEIVGLLPD